MAIPNLSLDALVEILLDKSVDIGVRDDAAMDLGTYSDDDKALNVLIQVARDKDEHEIILSSCGTSIADIWLARRHFDGDILDSLASEARQEVYVNADILKEKTGEMSDIN